MNPVQSLMVVGVLLVFSSNSSGFNEIEKCLQKEVLIAEDSQTIAELKKNCVRSNSEYAADKSVESLDAGVHKESNSVDIYNPLESYKDNYLVWGHMHAKDDMEGPFGRETNDLKFRFGFSYSLSRKYPEMKFAYSQKSFWELDTESKPFWDHNFNPEFFYTFEKPVLKKLFILNAIPKMNYLRLGVEHESNGTDDVDSREWNRSYIKSEFDISDSFKLNVKLWNVAKDDGNKVAWKKGKSVEKTKMEDFLGNFELGFKQKINHRLSWQVAMTKGRNSSKYNFQTDFILTFARMYPEVFLTFHDGYGESLLTYDLRTTSARIGIRFSPR